MIHTVRGNGVPYELCGTYLFNITTVAQENPETITVGFHIEETGHDIYKQFKFNKMLYHLLKELGQDVKEPIVASNIIGQSVWGCIAIDEDKEESFIFKFFDFVDKESKPALAGDPSITKDGLPSGRFLRFTEQVEL